MWKNKDIALHSQDLYLLKNGVSQYGDLDSKRRLVFFFHSKHYGLALSESKPLRRLATWIQAPKKKIRCLQLCDLNIFAENKDSMLTLM